MKPCKTCEQNARDAKEYREDYIAVLRLLARIREAVGDPAGKLMQDELVSRCRMLRHIAEGEA